jgi:hypothetical protein
MKKIMYTSWQRWVIVWFLNNHDSGDMYGGIIYAACHVG